MDMVLLHLFQRANTQLYPKAVISVIDLPGARMSEGVDLTQHDLRIDTDAAGLAYARKGWVWLTTS